MKTVPSHLSGWQEDSDASVPLKVAGLTPLELQYSYGSCALLNPRGIHCSCHSHGRFFNKIYLFEWGQGQRERERESPKQAPQLNMKPGVGLDLMTLDDDPSQNQDSDA